MKTRHKVGGAALGALLLATPLVANFEGLWLTVKPDRLAYNVPTGGFGETEGVKLGETHTKEYWMARLQMRLPQYDARITPCIKVELPNSVRAALISLAYNAGSSAVCRSSVLAKMNAGDIRGGCEAIKGWYIRAGGSVRQGLINRRAKERKVCLEGL